MAHATGINIYDTHLRDAANLTHPSYFDSTQDYAMVVFRKLALDGNGAVQATGETPDKNRKTPSALTKLATRPVTFLLTKRALITVRASDSRTIEAIRNRLLEYKGKTDGSAHVGRPPTSPEELMLRLLNAMVDQYLALRQPLTGQIDRWQRVLLNPRSRFNDWNALLTLITDIFGMNFAEMPPLKDRSGFWITAGMMMVIAVGLLLFFWRKRYLDDPALNNDR